MALESNLYALWGAKQTAKGTPATEPKKRFVQVAGDISTNREDGAENFSNLDRFGDMTDFVNTIAGEGSPGFEAMPTETAWLCWVFFGADTVTGSADPWKHLFTPQTNGGFFATFWKRVGGSVVQREKFNDCKLGQLVMEGSSGQKVIRIAPAIFSLDPGEIFTADPTPAVEMTTEDPFLWTEGSGTFAVNGVTLRGSSQFTATWDEGLSPYYGDDVVPVDLITSNANISLGTTILVDSAGQQEYNKRIYGTATPTTGTKPLHTPENLGSYGFTLTKKNAAGVLTPSRKMEVAFPGVKWAPDLSIPPSPDGGPVELSLAGSMRKVGAEPGSKITIECGNAAFTG
jgi:hypothetical protein